MYDKIGRVTAITFSCCQLLELASFMDVLMSNLVAKGIELYRMTVFQVMYIYIYIYIYIYSQTSELWIPQLRNTQSTKH